MFSVPLSVLADIASFNVNVTYLAAHRSGELLKPWTALFMVRVSRFAQVAGHSRQQPAPRNKALQIYRQLDSLGNQQHITYVSIGQPKEEY